MAFHLRPPCPCPWPGQDSPFGSRAVIGDYIRPRPLPGDTQEPPSAKPPFLSRSGSSRCRFESDVSPAPGRGPVCEEEGGSGRTACSGEVPTNAHAHAHTHPSARCQWWARPRPLLSPPTPRGCGCGKGAEWAESLCSADSETAEKWGPGRKEPCATSSMQPSRVSHPKH